MADSQAGAGRPGPEARQDGAGGPDGEVPPNRPRKLDRLPPPAFPPGARRTAPTRSPPDGDGETSLAEQLPEGALISPDEPVRRVSGKVPEDAFISPDEPIRSRDPLPGRPQDAAATEDDVVVTGIGEQDPAYYRSPSAVVADMHDIEQAAPVLEDLARQIRADGVAALFLESGLSRFESALRSFLAGYFARGSD